MRIGDRIKELRTSYGITQVQLAEMANISRSVISQYESNLVEPTASVAAKLAIALNTSTDYLLGLEDDFGVRVAGTDNSDTPATAEERKLLADYRALPEELRALIREQMALFTKAEGIITDKK